MNLVEMDRNCMLHPFTNLAAHEAKGPPISVVEARGSTVTDSNGTIELGQVPEEGRNDPELVRDAPHNQVVAKINQSGLDNPDQWATTWDASQRRRPEGYIDRSSGGSK